MTMPHVMLQNLQAEELDMGISTHGYTRLVSPDYNPTDNTLPTLCEVSLVTAGALLSW